MKFPAQPSVGNFIIFLYGAGVSNHRLNRGGREEKVGADCYIIRISPGLRQSR